MKTRLILLSMILFIIDSANSIAQIKTKEYPIIGEPCPDFKFTSVTNYKQKTVSLSDFVGKYFIMDFWSKTCGSCISSFPESNKMQQEFGDKLQILLVGHQDAENQVQPLFNRIKTLKQIILPCAFDSLYIFKFVPHRTVPNLVWVDNKGIVVAVTTSTELNEFNINKFLRGQKFDFFDMSFEADFRNRKAFDQNRLFLLDKNGGNDTSFLYRSILSMWQQDRGYPSGNMRIDENIVNRKLARFQVVGVPLAYLYNYAYYGQGVPLGDSILSIPIVKVKDSINFYHRDSKEEISYCYSLQAPGERANKNDLMSIMQGDLKNYFGYQVEIECKNMPCLNLTVIDQKKVEKLRSKTNNEPEEKWQKGLGGYFKNCTITDLVASISGDLPSGTKVFNKTNLEMQIDVKIDAATFDLISVRKSLNASGLDLEPSTTQLKVLTIKD